MSHHRRAGAPTGPGSAVPTRRWALAADQPAFWMASAAVFMINAVLSAAAGQWAMAVLASTTGLLALVAAAASTGRANRG